MNKKLLLQDLSQLLAEREGIDKRKAENFLRNFFELTEEALLTDSFVKVSGFGTTKLVDVSERESVNINTGERFQISGHTKVSFTPDTLLRDLINRPFAHFTTVSLHDDTTEEELEAVIVEDPQVPKFTEENFALDEKVVESSSADPFPFEEEKFTSRPFPLTPESTLNIAATQEETNLPPKENNKTTDDLSFPAIPLPIKELTSVNTETTLSRHKTNGWMIACLISASLLIMLVSFLIGYHCGNNRYTFFNSFHSNVSNTHVVPSAYADILPVVSATPTVPPDTHPSCSGKTQPSLPKKQALPSSESKKNVQSLTPSTPTDATSTEALKALAEKYQQMPRGNYLIVGTLQSHMLRPGENLYHLAKKTYGDRDMARYIILHNGIQNPDLVSVGQTVKLPKLLHK